MINITIAHGGRRYQLSSEVWERENLYIINEMPEKKVKTFAQNLEHKHFN